MDQRARRGDAQVSGGEAGSLALPDDLDAMLGVKLWQNPCWLSFRVNYIGHHFNQPLYAHIQRR